MGSLVESLSIFVRKDKGAQIPRWLEGKTVIETANCPWISILPVHFIIEAPEF